MGIMGDLFTVISSLASTANKMTCTESRKCSHLYFYILYLDFLANSYVRYVFDKKWHAQNPMNSRLETPITFFDTPINIAIHLLLR